MNTGELQWHPRRPTVPMNLIHSNEIHVWRVFLDLTTLEIESLLGILSADELERARRFSFEKDERRFIVAHGILRKILGPYLEKNPHEIHFEHTGHGKPVLANNLGYDTLRFNMSHAGAFALYAVTRNGNIGIDVERVRDDIDIDQIARRYFSKNEISSLESLSQDKRSEVFFQYWTRKEAFIKATGEGISFPMERCDVSLISGTGLSPITLLNHDKEGSYWYGQDLFPGLGYAAAIAIDGSDWDLSCWDYSV